MSLGVCCRQHKQGDYRIIWKKTTVSDPLQERKTIYCKFS